MRDLKDMSNLTRWGFYIFGAIVVILNGVETALFGATYLTAAFGSDPNGVPALLAGAYALVILDIGYLVWFRLWLSGGQSTAQRDIGLALAVLSLAGSTMATVTQLAINTTLAPALVPYRPLIGTIAFFIVLVVTVGHIVGLAVHKYNDPNQLIETRQAQHGATVLGLALKEMDNRIEADTGAMVDALAQRFRGATLGRIGFDQDLNFVGVQRDGADVAQVEGDVDPAVAQAINVTHPDKGGDLITPDLIAGLLKALPLLQNAQEGQPVGVGGGDGGASIESPDKQIEDHQAPQAGQTGDAGDDSKN